MIVHNGLLEVAVDNAVIHVCQDLAVSTRNKLAAGNSFLINITSR